MENVQTIEVAELETVNGGVDWGKAHTILTQGLGCAGGGAMVGAMVSGPFAPYGAAIGGIGAGAACSYTAYKAMQQQESAEAAKAQAPAQK